MPEAEAHEQRNDGHDNGSQSTEDVLDKSQLVQTHKFLNVSYVHVFSLSRKARNNFFLFVLCRCDEQRLFLLPPGWYKHLSQQGATCSSDALLEFRELCQVAYSAIQVRSSLDRALLTIVAQSAF